MQRDRQADGRDEEGGILQRRIKNNSVRELKMRLKHSSELQVMRAEQPGVTMSLDKTGETELQPERMKLM